MTPQVQTLLLSAGTTAVVGALGAWLVIVLARRSLRAAALATPLAVVAAVAVGVWASAWAMFLSAHDLSVVLIVLAGSIPVAVGFGLLLARRVNRLEHATAATVRARERDAELEAGRREMVAWVSHDLRTPLAGIRAMAESLEDGVASDPQRYLARIRTESDRMARMVDDLLALSRLQSGTLALARQRVSLADLVSDVLATSQPVAAQQQVRLEGRATTDAVTEADTRELGRALANLVLNAVRHTPPDGTVAVVAEVVEGAAVVSVHDGCGGIPVEDLPRVFDAGWRGSGARTPADDTGAGLGLAIVHGVVAAHGGEVTVTNEGSGCRFDVRLQLAGA